MWTDQRFFPYEWVDALGKLEGIPLPPREMFQSSLKNTNISEKEYAYFEQVWEENEMQTF